MLGRYLFLFDIFFGCFWFIIHIAALIYIFHTIDVDSHICVMQANQLVVSSIYFYIYFGFGEFFGCFLYS